MEIDVTWLKNLFKGKESFITVAEGKKGIECFANYKEIQRLEDPYKKQLKAFIESVLEVCKDGENVKPT